MKRAHALYMRVMFWPAAIGTVYCCTNVKRADALYMRGIIVTCGAHSLHKFLEIKIFVLRCLNVKIARKITQFIRKFQQLLTHELMQKTDKN